ncbi:hypothetical protein JCM21714_141 [Gracilibacillus boraciitolerans JCM 21714]|uniref:Uncharacterized protein n=1 Tax=Gracilibacillus boraciitolerans JCM 21714 TaxID=1298598 RepID=W4VCQ3_9BACI|nr:5-formyltetrahydrofolate cyclo-ligase [Gracilibacillus boraciitolerans]GAE91200.1 hypothetical protein JCM21714_141 [Gracilibacillus boraciitolerans JCM 21714]
MNKKHIRQDTLAAWNRISNKEEIEHAMYTRLFRLEIWQKANIIGITYSKESEWNTNVLINQAWQENKIITIPRTDFAYSTMQFYHYQHGDSLESRG